MYVSTSIMWGKYTWKSINKVSSMDIYGRYVCKHTSVRIKQTKKRTYTVVG